MRGLAVLTVVLVFAASPLFVGSASAQSGSSGSLAGLVCLSSPSIAGGYSNTTEAMSCSYWQGLPDATVTLTPSGSLPVVGSLEERSATSDGNGFYSFQELTPGQYAFEVVRAGFKTATGTLTVESGSHRDFLLGGEAVQAASRVLDPDGKPVAKAAVNLCCDETGQRSASTDGDGRFSQTVTAGYWSIDVQASGFQGQSQYVLVDGSALPDIRLERIPPQDARVAGRVVDQDGNPVPDARVSLYSYGNCCYAYDGAASSPEMSYRPSYSGENVTFTGADGRFSMGAYAGSNGFTVTKDGYASHSRTIEVASGKTASADVELLKYPEKTAKVVGKVVDARTGKGLANAYVNLQSPQYGIYECSQPESSGSGSSGSDSDSDTDSGSPASGPGSATYTATASKGIAYPGDYYDPGCAIKVRSDGSFEGLVSPGYAIVSVWIDNYASCAESTDADGSFTRTCGPEYYSWSSSRMLPADATTTFDVKVRSRPAPDAEVSGYVVDAETHKAIPGATISFSNQDTYGYGTATADGDGSYRLRLRSGYHSVSVWAEGHLRWEGVLDVAKGDSDFDVEVQPGTESYGYCCPMPYAMAGGVGYAEDASVKSSGPMTASATSTGSSMAAPQAAGAADGSGSGNQAEQYQDLGGGLGPYDPAKRAGELEDSGSNGVPGVGLLAVLAALGAVLVMRRRLA